MNIAPPKSLNPALALAAVILVALASWTSWVAVGDGVCGGSGGSPNLNSTSGAAAWCRFVDPGWNRGTFYGTPVEYQRLFGREPGQGGPLLRSTTLDRVRSTLPLSVPILMILAGTALALWTRNRRYFRWCVVASAIALLVPWTTVTILAA
jgi:hypothetical protein